MLRQIIHALSFAKTCCIKLEGWDRRRAVSQQPSLILLWQLHHCLTVLRLSHRCCNRFPVTFTHEARPASTMSCHTCCAQEWRNERSIPVMRNGPSEGYQKRLSVRNTLRTNTGNSFSSAVGASTRPDWNAKLSQRWRSCRPGNRSCLAMGTCRKQPSWIQQQCRLYQLSGSGV